MTIIPQDFTQKTTENRGDMQNASSEFSVTNPGTAFYQEIFTRHKVKQKYWNLSQHLHLTLLVGSNLSQGNWRFVYTPLFPWTHILWLLDVERRWDWKEKCEKKQRCWSFPKRQYVLLCENVKGNKIHDLFLFSNI